MLDLARLGAERGSQPVVGRAQHRLDLGHESVRLVLGEHALRDELRLVELAHAWMPVDLLDHQRLRVGGLVLLVVTEAAIADEIDHDVLAEAAAVRHREPDRGNGRLGIVGVDVNDRDVEALREVGRVTGRAAFARVGREPDLVVRDQMQRPTGRIALEAVQVEGLCHDALPGERRIAVEEHRQRDRRIVSAVRSRAIRLLGARSSLDDGIDRFEMARVRDEPHPDLAVRGRPRPVGGEVVLDVARPALGVGRDGIERPLAFELTQDVLVGHPDRVRENVQPPPVRHAHHDVVRAGLGGELDRLVEHRDHHVEPLERELLLAEEALPQEPLHAVDLAQAPVEQALLVGAQRLSVPAGFDRLP